MFPSPNLLDSPLLGMKLGVFYFCSQLMEWAADLLDIFIGQLFRNRDLVCFLESHFT